MAKKEIKNYLFALGILLAIVAPVLEFGGMTLPWIAWLTGLIGFVIGLIWEKGDVKTFLAILLLMAITGIPASWPMVGGFIQSVLKNLAVFFGALAIVPAIKILISKKKLPKL